MLEILRRAVLVFLLVLIAGCADEDEESSITGPEFNKGPGRIYPVKEVTFPSTDGIQVSAMFGPADLDQEHPVVILLHDLGSDKQIWLSRTALFVELVERGYLVVAVDMRGSGDTPLPDDRQVLFLEDLEASFLDVLATLLWLQDQPGADMSRIGLIGDGSGGNVAYVSMGVFPELIKTAISLSPGLWERDTFRPVVIGAGLEPFGPRSILFMVGGQDVLSDGGDIVLSYADFSMALASTTGDPKSVLVFEDSADHGLELLNNVPAALDSLLLWLEENL